MATLLQNASAVPRTVIPILAILVLEDHQCRNILGLARMTGTIE